MEACFGEVLLPILDGAMQQQLSYPKTIYMPLQWCSYAYGMACQMASHSRKLTKLKMASWTAHLHNFMHPKEEKQVLDNDNDP